MRLSTRSTSAIAEYSDLTPQLEAHASESFSDLLLGKSGVGQLAVSRNNGEQPAQKNAGYTTGKPARVRQDKAVASDAVTSSSASHAIPVQSVFNTPHLLPGFVLHASGGSISTEVTSQPESDTPQAVTLFRAIVPENLAASVPGPVNGSWTQLWPSSGPGETDLGALEQSPGRDGIAAAALSDAPHTTGKAPGHAFSAGNPEGALPERLQAASALAAQGVNGQSVAGEGRTIDGPQARTPTVFGGKRNAPQGSTGVQLGNAGSAHVSQGQEDGSRIPKPVSENIQPFMREGVGGNSVPKTAEAASHGRAQTALPANANLNPVPGSVSTPPGLAISGSGSGTGTQGGDGDANSGGVPNSGVKLKDKAGSTINFVEPMNATGSSGSLSLAGALVTDGVTRNSVNDAARSLGTPTQPSSPSNGEGPALRGETSGPGVLSPVTNARLMQSFDKSEMQVSLQSEEFGRVTVHAAYGREAISTQITLENAQLGSTLAAHVPAMEQKLGQDHGVRVSVSIDTQARNDSGTRQQAQQESQSGRRSQPGAAATSTGSAASGAPIATTATISTTSSSLGSAHSRRLDVRI